MSLILKKSEEYYIFYVHLVVNGLDMTKNKKIEIGLKTEGGLNFLIYENVFSSLTLKVSNSTPLKIK